MNVQHVLILKNLLDLLLNPTCSDTNWYFDSGATTHVTGDPRSFTTIKQAIGNQNVKSAAR
jgi:hypothetical protein